MEYERLKWSLKIRKGVTGVKRKSEIERKLEALGRRIEGTEVTKEARADSALFVHGAYEALAWVLELWEET